MRMLSVLVEGEGKDGRASIGPWRHSNIQHPLVAILCGRMALCRRTFGVVNVIDMHLRDLI